MNIRLTLVEICSTEERLNFKIERFYFELINLGIKKAELRSLDRGEVRVGDVITLHNVESTETLSRKVRAVWIFSPFDCARLFNIFSRDGLQLIEF